MLNVFDDELTETSSFGSVPVLDSLPSETVKETDDTLKSKGLDSLKIFHLLNYGLLHSF